MFGSFTKFLGFGGGIPAVASSVPLMEDGTVTVDEINFGVKVGQEVERQLSEIEKSKTPTPYPTYTPYPTLTPYPTMTSIPVSNVSNQVDIEQVSILSKYLLNYVPPEAGRYDGDLKGDKSDVKIKVSYYWPPYALFGGKWTINCDVQNGTLECLQMSTGQYWYDYVGIAAACPDQWPIGTVIGVGSDYWVCMDRGGEIKKQDDLYWVDFLYPNLPYGNFGDVFDAKIWIP